MLIRCLHFLRYAILVVGALHLLPNILVSLCLVDRVSNGEWNQAGQSLALLLGAIAYFGAWRILQRHKTSTSSLTRTRLEKEVWQKIQHNNYLLQFNRVLLLVTACTLLLAFTCYNVRLGFSKSSFTAAHVASRCGQFELSERIYKTFCNRDGDSSLAAKRSILMPFPFQTGVQETLAVATVYGSQSDELADLLMFFGMSSEYHGYCESWYYIKAKSLYRQNGNIRGALDALSIMAILSYRDNPEMAQRHLKEAAELIPQARHPLSRWTILDLKSAATKLHDYKIPRLIDHQQKITNSKESSSSLPEPVSRLLMYVWIFGLTGLGGATTKASIVLWRCFRLKLRLLSLLKDATAIANGPQGDILDSARDANNWAIIANIGEQIDLALYRNKQSSADELSRWLLSWVERGATGTAAPRQFKLQSHEELKQQIDRASILLCTEFACFILLMLLASTLWMHREF